MDHYFWSELHQILLRTHFCREHVSSIDIGAIQTKNNGPFKLIMCLMYYAQHQVRSFLLVNKGVVILDLCNLPDVTENNKFDCDQAENTYFVPSSVFVNLFLLQISNIFYRRDYCHEELFVCEEMGKVQSNEPENLWQRMCCSFYIYQNNNQKPPIALSKLTTSLLNARRYIVTWF